MADKLYLCWLFQSLNQNNVQKKIYLKKITLYGIFFLYFSHVKLAVSFHLVLDEIKTYEIIFLYQILSLINTLCCQADANITSLWLLYYRRFTHGVRGQTAKY